MVISDQRCLGMRTPLGITSKPVLSYRLESNDRNVYQAVRQIIVSSTMELALSEIGDLWDSGQIKTEECFAISYEGKELESGQKAYWRVKAWDQNNNETDWSDISCFEMGLLKESDWEGKWIGQGEKSEEDQSEAVAFLGDFSIELSEVESARAYISGLGLFEASINGARLSDTYFEPGESDATKSVYYVTYDIKEALCEGKNVLRVLLGNGQYCGYKIEPVMSLPDGSNSPRGRYQKDDSAFTKEGICGRKKLIAQVVITTKDGKKRIVCASDENWHWVKSPITFQNWYGGEDYDACMEDEYEKQCSVKGNRDSQPNAVRMIAPEGTLRARECNPIRIQESFFAESVIKIAEGHFIADMGKNGAGIIELRLDTDMSSKGNVISLYPAEVLNEEKNGVDQRSCTQSLSERRQCVICDSYRIKGTGKESWSPKFCYHGFRYVEVKNFPGELQREQIVYHRLYADNEKQGTFHSSNEILNKICEITDRSIESNMFWSFTDCPQIEKLGWIETSHLMFRSVASVFDIDAWMRKIIRDIADSQLDEEQAKIPDNELAGFVPGIIPEYYRIKGLYRDPNWNGACVFTPWEHYQWYGDISVLKIAYPVIINYLDYLWEQSKDGILEDYA